MLTEPLLHHSSGNLYFPLQLPGGTQEGRNMKKSLEKNNENKLIKKEVG